MPAAVFALTLAFLLPMAAILIIELSIKIRSVINSRKQKITDEPLKPSLSTHAAPVSQSYPP